MSGRSGEDPWEGSRRSLLTQEEGDPRTSESVSEGSTEVLSTPGRGPNTVSVGNKVSKDSRNTNER